MFNLPTVMLLEERILKAAVGGEEEHYKAVVLAASAKSIIILARKEQTLEEIQYIQTLISVSSQRHYVQVQTTRIYAGMRAYLNMLREYKHIM